MHLYKQKWTDSVQYHKALHDEFCQKTNKNEQLKALRDFVELNAFGFGERSFYQMWSLIIDEMPDSFSFLEIGVFRGQTLALIRMLAEQKGKKAKIYGVTPMDSTDGHWESNYEEDIARIHSEFRLRQPILIKGLSTDPEIISNVNKLKSFDLVYIDGGHTREVIDSDLKNYAPMADKYLIIDDCCNDLQIGEGLFPGIQPVTDSVNDYLQNNPDLIFQSSVVHNKIFKWQK